MKLIDDKGRIFGRVNIIDLLVIVAVVLVAVFLGSKVMGGGGGLGSSTKLSYTVLVYNVDATVYESMVEMDLENNPDQLMADGNLLNGHVTGMTAVPSSGQVYSVMPNDEGSLSVATRPQGTYDLTFTVEATVGNAVKCEVGTQEVRIGKKHIVKTTNFEFEEGVILTCLKEAAQ